jgi:hypothetical protein
LSNMSISLNELGLRPSMIPCDMHLDVGGCLYFKP